MTPHDIDSALTLARTRRHFFRDCGVGVGVDGPRVAAARSRRRRRAGAQRPARAEEAALPAEGEGGHLPVHGRRAEPARTVRRRSRSCTNCTARRCPSRSSQGKRFAFIKGDAKLLGTQRKFAQGTASAAWTLSELLPHHREIVDDVCWLRGDEDGRLQPRPGEVLHQHRLAAVRPAEHGRVGHLRPRQRIATACRGSSCCNPARAGRAAGRRCWGSGFLPTRLPGRAVPAAGRARSSTSRRRRASTPKQQGEFVDAVRDLNKLRLDATGDPEIETRIAAYEMAYRMQTSAPELMDLGEGAAEDARHVRRRAGQAVASRPTACWPAGWSSAACGSCSSTTPTGTTTAADARTSTSRSTQICKRSRSGRAPRSSRT